MKAAKILISVYCGLASPGDLPDLTRTWSIDSTLWDQAIHGDMKTDPDARDAVYLIWDAHAAAVGYAREMMDPRHVNMVRLEWVYV